MNYVELWIGNPAETKLDLNQEFNIALQYSIADIKDITKRNSAFSKTILLPGTKNNNYWMGNLYDVNTDFTMFNPNIKTPATLSVNSEVVMKGFLQLRKIKKLNNVDQQGNLINYEVVLFNNTVDLMTELGEKPLNSLNLEELNHDYTFNNIVFSWTQSWTNGWVYPMYGLPGRNNQYGVTDFYPGYYSRYLIDKIFNEAGFGWTGSLRNNEQFQREIIPFVGSGSQSISQEDIVAKNFRVGITQSFTHSLILGTTSGNSAVILSSIGNQFQVNLNNYPFNADNYSDPFNTNNDFYDNDNQWSTTAFVWTTTANRKWKPTYSLDYDLQFSNPATQSGSTQSPTFSNAIHVVNSHYWTYQAVPSVASLGVDNFKLGISHILEYKLPSSNNWTNWYTDFRAYTGWTASSPLGYLPGVTHSETIRVSNVNAQNMTELFLPIGSQVRLRINIKPWTGGGSGPLSYFYNTYSAFRSLGNYVWNTPFYDGNQRRRMRMTFKFNAFNSSFKSNGIEFAAQELDEIRAGDWISSKIKQKDFINDLIKRYNLYIQVDPTNERMLILDTRPDFYDKVLNLDWTDKKDYSSEDEISLLSELQFKEMLFTMKSDTSDPFNKDYQDLVGEVYGQYKYTFGNEFVKGQQKTESPFSPTPLVKTDFGAITPALSPEDPKVSPRVLYWGGLKSTPYTGFTWKLTGQTQVGTFTQYPYAGHFDDPFAPTLDIHFGTPKFMYYFDYGTLPTDTMYETYWADWVNQIEDGRLVKSKFYLDEYDIRLIKDNFWAKIFILDSYYYVNKIIDYMPMQNGLTTVELLKIKEGQKYKKQPSRTATIARPIAAVKPVFQLPNFGFNNGTGVIKSLVVGDNNITGGQVGDVYNKQIVIGDGNNVSGDKSAVIAGDNNILNGSSNILIQSSNITTEGDNLVIISNSDATFSDVSSAYIGTGIKGDLATKPGRYLQYQKGVNLSVEGYNLGQSDWRYIPTEKEVVIQSGKESRPSDLTILGSLEIEDITGTFSFGDSVRYKQGFLEVENQLNIDGVMTVGGELHVGKCMVGGGGGSGQSGSSGTSGTSFGSSGTSGTSGSTGQSGTSGTSGSTGQSGTSGTSGVTITQNLDQTLTVGNTGSVILLENGSLSTPSYSFASDTDTGIYRNTTNELSISTGGIQSAIFATNSVEIPDGVETLPGLSFISQPNMGLYRPSANIMIASVAGVAKFGFLTNYVLNYSSALRNQDGTAAAPSFTFNNDPDTGIYRAGLNTMGIAGGGATVSTYTNNDITHLLTGGVVRFTGDINRMYLQIGTQAVAGSGSTFSIGKYGSTVTTVRFDTINNRTLFSDGSAGVPAITFISDTDTGIYRSSGDEMSFVTTGSQRIIVAATVVRFLLNTRHVDGTVGTPAFHFFADQDTGIYRPGDNQLGISAGGVTASVFTSTGVVFHKNPRLYSPDGTLWEISVLDTGALTASAVI